MAGARVRALTLAAALFVAVTSSATAHDGEHHGKEENGWPGSAKAQELARAFLADAQPAQELQAQSGGTSCTDGLAAGYPCSNVDLMSFLPLADIGDGKGNDVWGWTDVAADPDREYAIMGRTNGTSFVDVTDPANPVYLGNLPTTRFSSTWRDIKVYANHAFVVSESRNHGMQVFDLTRLRTVTSPPVTFTSDAHYTGFATAHNIAINEDSGFAYAIGTNTCSGGLHIVDIRTPTSPTQAGCYSGDGYTHDVQCVNYAGPDASRHGRELCFASNEDTLTIVDVTDKTAPQLIARETYEGASYTHQGWLTDDQRYFLIDDELDEGNGVNTRTYVFDVANPAAPIHIKTYVGTNPAIDHNQYVVGNYSYQANYRSGLRILDIAGIGNVSGSGVPDPLLTEAAYFDIYPEDNAPEFNGAWSTYPFLASGNVLVSGIEQGLYVLRPNLGSTDALPSVEVTHPLDGGEVSGSVTVTASASDDVGVESAEFFVDGTSIGPVSDDGAGNWSVTWDTAGTADGAYNVTATATDTVGQAASHSVTVTVDNVDDPPIASFTYTCGGLVCDFDATTSNDDNGITSYAWEFGDGDTASGVTVQHSYNKGGTYTVNLTVSDASQTDTATASVTVVATMHVADLHGTSSSPGGSTWTATVTVTVVDAGGNPVSNAKVSGDWSGGSIAAGTCTTDSLGTCMIDSGSIPKREASVRFTVTDVAQSTLTYDPNANVETSIVVAKP